VFVVCGLGFGVCYQIALRNLLNFFLSGLKKLPTPMKEQAENFYCLAASRDS
jgi:hypothetical protein